MHQHPREGQLRALGAQGGDDHGSSRRAVRVTKTKSECSREISANNKVQLLHPSGGETGRQVLYHFPQWPGGSKLQLPTVVASWGEPHRLLLP